MWGAVSVHKWLLGAVVITEMTRVLSSLPNVFGVFFMTVGQAPVARPTVSGPAVWSGH